MDWWMTNYQFGPFEMPGREWFWLGVFGIYWFVGCWLYYVVFRPAKDTWKDCGRVALVSYTWPISLTLGFLIFAVWIWYKENR